MRDLLVPVLLVAAVFQPVAGVVFVLDGVLIGAGDGRYLAWGGLVVLAVFAPLALLAVRGGADAAATACLAVAGLRRRRSSAAGPSCCCTARAATPGWSPATDPRRNVHTPGVATAGV